MPRHRNLSPRGVAKLFAVGLSAGGMKDLYDTVECIAMSASIARDEGEPEGRFAQFACELLHHVESLGNEMDEEEQENKKEVKP